MKCAKVCGLFFLMLIGWAGKLRLHGFRECDETVLCRLVSVLLLKRDFVGNTSVTRINEPMWS